MKKYSFYTTCMAILFAVAAILPSCNNSETKDKTQSNVKPPATPWVNPRKNKIWDKVNVFEIPVTAMENHIIGKVKSVRYQDYNVLADGMQMLVDSGYNVYDSLGHLVNQNEYNRKGKLKYNCIYQYKGNNAKEWTYNNFTKEQGSTKMTFTYNDKGYKTNELLVDYNPDYSRKTNYTYDANGNELVEKKYSLNDILMEYTTNEYDNRNNQTSYIHRLGDGKTDWKMTALYDAKGNKIETYDFTADSLHPKKEVMSYSMQGWCTSTMYYKSDGQLESKTIRKYDDWGNITECTSYKADGTIGDYNVAHSYEYDETGNAIKTQDFNIENGKKILKSINISVYEYYK